MMFEQTFKNIDDILHKDAGCGSELDYVEQTSWILFLKYLDDLEKDRATVAELTGKPYTPIIDKEYQWTVWAMPKLSSPNGGGREGAKLDHHKAMTGDDLTDFVNNKLWTTWKKTAPQSQNSRENPTRQSLTKNINGQFGQCPKEQTENLTTTMQ